MYSENIHVGIRVVYFNQGCQNWVAGYQRKSLPTWLVLAGYSAWHFFTGGVF